MPKEENGETIQTNVHFDCLILIRKRSHWALLIKWGRLATSHEHCHIINVCPLLISFHLAIKNQATGHYILNGKGEEAKSRTFIDLGVEWDYNIEDDIETLHTDGPLHDPVIVLVCTMHHVTWLGFVYNFII